MRFSVSAVLDLWGFLYDAWSLSSVLKALSFVLGCVAVIPYVTEERAKDLKQLVQKEV